jgi:hypothetical protein
MLIYAVVIAQRCCAGWPEDQAGCAARRALTGSVAVEKTTSHRTR